MDYDALVADVQEIFEDDGTELLAAIPDCIKRTENRIFKDVPNLPPFRTTGTGSMVVGTATVAKPTDTRIIRQMSYVNGSSQEVFLLRRTDSFVKQYWPTVSSTSTPKFFAEDDEGTLRIAPTPDDTYAYTVYILKKPTGMSSGNTTTELGDKYENVLTYGTFWESAKFLMDAESEARWEKDYKEEVAKLQQEVGRVYRNEYGSGV